MHIGGRGMHVCEAVSTPVSLLCGTTCAKPYVRAVSFIPVAFVFFVKLRERARKRERERVCVCV